MRVIRREINIFSMSALDLFASALGAFILITVMLFPFFPNTGMSPEHAADMWAKVKQAEQEREDAQAKQAAAEAEAREREQQIDSMEAEQQQMEAELERTREDAREKQAAAAEATRERKQTEEELERTREALSKAKFPDLDLMIAIDTTGSMQHPIHSLKEELTNLVDVLSRLAPSLGVGVVAFNDRMTTPVLRTHDLARIEGGAPGTHSPSFIALQQFIDSLHAGATLGVNPDWEEAVDQAVLQATRASWRPESRKRIIIVITDAPPYSDRMTALNATVNRFAADPRQSVSGIWIDSQSTGPNLAAQFLEALSTRGGGQYVQSGRSITSSILLAIID